MVTYPSTNLYLCRLISNSLHEIIFTTELLVLKEATMNSVI